MKRRLISMLFTVSASFVLALSSHAAPSMELTTEVWNVGEIFQWTNPSTTIGIKNAGDEDLIISDVKSSCGCTPAFVSENTIRPGETGFLRIDLASYLETGKIKKLVRLTTNDPARKVRDIRIVGNISEKTAAFGRLEEDYVDLGIVAPYETRYLELVLRNDGNKPLGVKEIVLPDGFFLNSAHPGDIKPRKVLPVGIGYKPPRASGLIYEKIVFDSPENISGPLEVRVVGYIGESSGASDSVVMTPAGFGIDVGGPYKLRMGLKNKGNLPITIEGVDSSIDFGAPPGYAPFIPAGKDASVEMTLDPAGMEPGEKGYIYIRLGIPVSVGGGG